MESKFDNVTLDLSDYNQGIHEIPKTFYNPNLIPLPKSMKNWTWINYTTIWAGMVHNVVQFEIAALLTFEFGPILALLITGLAYGTQLVVMYLNGHIGAKWGIPYPIAIRPMYGIKGSMIPVILRAFVALFWFAVQTYAGGTIVDAVLSIFIPSWNTLTLNVLGMPENLALSFLIFWGINVIVLFKGMNEVKYFELIVGPLIMLIFGWLAYYGITLSHGIGNIFSVKPELEPTFNQISISIGALVGAYSTLALNIMDFTRFSKTQKDQIVGQTIGFPIMFIIFTFLVAIIVSTMMYAFKIPYSSAMTYINPVNIMYLFTHNPLITLILGITLIFATVGVNTAANLVSPIYDFISLFPRRLKSWNRAAIIASLVGVTYAPWIWFNNATSIFNALNILGTSLGAVAGVMIAKYWILDKSRISLVDLFKPQGVYWYKNGISIKALASTLIGGLIPLIGIVIPQLTIIYTFGWYVAIITSMISYFALTVKSNLV
ncbi:MAG: cytosine permease [Sulfolobus sp.]